MSFCRDLDLVVHFADAVLNCPPEVVTKLPFYKDFGFLSPAEVEMLLKTQVMRYSFNTWKNILTLLNCTLIFEHVFPFPPLK